MNASLSPAQNVDSGADAESSLPMFWLSLFAAIATAGLLFAFQQVVHAAVNQADSNRMSASADARSAWLCRSAPTRAERQGCPAQSIGQRNDIDGTPEVTQAAFDPAAAGRP